nr:hypothetical protein [Tanacetum cinerariifolium]
MQNYISSTDLQCWNIVQKGNSQKNITSDTEDEHIGDFYHMIDAKQIWSAIKARFGGNAESTRMRRSLLKHQFEEYKASEEEGLDGGYDKIQKILSKINTLKIKPDQKDINMKFLRGLPLSWANIAQIIKVKGGLEYMSLDDLYNKFKCLEIDTKGYSVPASALANAGFVSSSSSSSSRNKLSYQEINGGGSFAKHSASKGSSSTKSSAIDDVIYSLIADDEEDQHLAFEDLDQARKFEKKYERPVQFDSREAVRFDKKLAKCFKCKKTGHFARECRSQVTQESINYKNYKKKEAEKEASESSALVVIDGSQGVNWDKQLQENTTEPGVLGNYGFVAEKGTNSTVPADDAVPADSAPASAFISAEPTILADRVIAAEASILAADGIPTDSKFAMMSLPSKVSLPIMCPLSTNLSAGNQGPSSNNAGCQDSDSDSDDEQDVIIVQNSPTPVTTPVHDVPNHEEAAQSVLSLSLDLNDDDMEELSSLQTQEQEGKDATQRLGLAFPTHVVTIEASSIPAEKSSSVSPASTPTASAGNTPPMSPRPSAGRSSKSTWKKLAFSFKTPIPAGRSVSADKSIPAGRSVFAHKSIPTDRSIFASRDTNSADGYPSKLFSNAVSERFPPASNT